MRKRMRLIDADKFYDELKERSDAALKWYKEETDEENKTKAGASVITFCEVKLTLDNQPTIDAVPVVKCRDCKFNYANYIPCEDSCFKFADLPISKDFYCACGEIFID